MTITRVLALTAAAAVLAGCDGPSAPAGPEGSYELRTFDGRNLPVWANATGVQGSGRELRGGTLRLRAPNALQLELRNRLVDAQGKTAGTVSDTLHGTWSAEGEALTLTVQAKGMYWMEPGATLTGGRRIDAVLHLVAPAYTGNAHTLVDVAFTR